MRRRTAQHAYGCPFPEGCTCGASEWNASMEAINRMKQALREIEAGNLDGETDEAYQARARRIAREAMQ